MLLATLAGLAAAVWAFGSIGLGSVLAVAGRIGIDGFLIFCAFSIGTFFILGGAWLAAAPGEPLDRIGLFAWARAVREAVSDLLPFSQIGGIVVGTRTLTSAGIPASRVYASFVVDMTTEMGAQLVFTLFGLAMMVTLLAGGGEAAALRPLILGGTGVMIAGMVMFFFAQRPALGLAGRVAQHFLPGSVVAMTGITDALRETYSRRRRVALAFALNLLGWIASGIGGWIVLLMMGADISIWSALSIESLIFTLRSVAFAVPGAIGVQEAAYALAAPLFGLPPETALALSLAKRARDLAIGLPTLILWQVGEMRAVVLASRRG
ncbi:MAG: lysylphosphatidylglycerol synthase domain-containing protein [Candidatus Sphingomonas phytovorans]|nr:lysylphosphatidylglycerol synthase domain-containing protein [Sphingomonas sp.]WEJ99577.1 MAG: lysylphosphatidylglycerol synthase domain-containing protein [Sphingomonas sp.]